MDADGWKLYRQGKQSARAFRNIKWTAVAGPGHWGNASLMNFKSSYKAVCLGQWPGLTTCPVSENLPVLSAREQRTATLLSQYLLGDLIIVLPSDYHLHLPSDQITLNFLAGFDMPSTLGNTCPRAFPWDLHTPKDAVWFSLENSWFTRASKMCSSASFHFKCKQHLNINTKVSICFTFALKMPYRSIITGGSGGKPSSASLSIFSLSSGPFKPERNT